MTHDIASLRIRIFADGADLAGIREMKRLPFIKGFTTNPTLMRQAGVTDYKAFALEALAAVEGMPLSLEVFADDLASMERQAMEIASWGSNVNVKIPVTNTLGESTAPLVHRLSRRGVVCNVTAIFTEEQLDGMVAALDPETPAILSVFGGRIADTGIDPEPIMRRMLERMRGRPRAELLWASPRELLNIFQANACGCHIITATHDILKKIPNIGKDLPQFSLETVQMFYRDAMAASYTIPMASDIDIEDLAGV